MSDDDRDLELESVSKNFILSKKILSRSNFNNLSSSRLKSAHIIMHWREKGGITSKIASPVYENQYLRFKAKKW